MKRLPSEIVCQIFFWIREADITNWPYPALQDMKRARIDWIKNCTHVCSRWRSAALAWPELWSNLVFSGTKGGDRIVQMMLQRSSGHSLRISWAPDGGLASLSLAMQHLPRVSSLTLGCMDRNILSELAIRLSDAGAPLLQELVLQLSDECRDQILPDPFASLLSGLGGRPVLARLHLSTPLPVDMQGLKVPLLTSLYLSGSRASHGNLLLNRPAFDILPVLASLPHLIELRIDRIYIDSQTQPGTRTEPIVFRKLKLLHFYNGSTHKTVFLFHHLRAAQLLASLTLMLSDTSLSFKELSSTLSGLYHEHQETLRRNPFQSLTVQDHGPTTYTITLGSNLYNHQITLSFKSIPSYDTSDPFSSLFRALPLTDVHNLEVKGVYAAKLFASKNLLALKDSFQEEPRSTSNPSTASNA